MSPGYLSVTPFCFQDFGSFSLSLFGILYHVGSLSPLLLFGLVGIYPVPLPAEYFSAFSSCLYCYSWGAFSYSGSLWFLFIVEFPLYCGVSSLWVEFDGWLVKVSWLEKLVSVLVGGAGFLLSGVQ